MVAVRWTQYFVLASFAALASADVSRFMNNTNFRSHNLPDGGCNPAKTSENFTTALKCQAACDASHPCVMWTFVPKTYTKSPLAPLCCLKNCTVGNQGSQCPAPEVEQGVISGVKDPSSYGKCKGPTCFAFDVNWNSGGPRTTLPGCPMGANATPTCSVRKLEAIYYPPDGRTYAYVDIVNFTDFYYPDSYSSEVGVFSSPDGRTGWRYHGIVVPRGPAGGWDGGGIASPGAAVTQEGRVIVGYAAEKSASGGINRGIGIAIADHPLGPFVKSETPIADPHTICGASGRCDDVIMQSRPGGEVHLYHSVKGGAPPPGPGIRHRMSKDGGLTWGPSTMVLSHSLQPGHNPAETIAGKFFPSLLGGQGAMVLITDGGPGFALHAYLSAGPGDMLNFSAASEPTLATHPPTSSGTNKGDWANLQIGFVPNSTGHVRGVTYALWTGVPVRSEAHHGMSQGYTHTVYDIELKPGGAISAA